MITQTDIRKLIDAMKEIFPTKEDFDHKLKKELASLEMKLDSKINRLDRKIDKNTEDLIELITSGFHTQQSGFDNHERRISRLEKAIPSASLH